MRLSIFAYPDYDFLFPMLCQLLARIRKEGKYTPVSMALFPNKLGPHQGWKIPRYYLSLLGPMDFGRLAARSLAARAGQAGQVLAGDLPAFSYKGLARAFDIPLAHFRDPNEADAVAWVKKHDTDILLIFVGQILKKDILAAPRCCTLNKHSALLPAYRGLFPVFWAKKNGHPVGVSVHEVIERIDAGRLLAQERCDDPDASVYSHYARIYREAPDLLLRSLDVAAGLAPAATIPHELPPGYFGLPDRSDYRAFKQAGHSFV